MTDVSTLVGSGLVAHTRAIDDPRDLLDHLGDDGFAWFEGASGFVTRGVAATISPRDALAFLRALPHERAIDAPDRAGPRAVGALGFEGTARMVVPAVLTVRDEAGRAWQTVVRGAHAEAVVELTPPLRIAPSQPEQFAITACGSAAEWRDAVVQALDLIDAGALEKVVLARAVQVDADRPFDVRRVLAELRRTQPGCTVYGAGGFVGASPELLVRKTAHEVVSRPLAGTGTDAARLRASRKDAHEHEIVVEAVREGLAVHCDHVRSEGPSPLGLADMTHLATTVTGHCRDAEMSVVDLAADLHPTPAIAGTPRAVALDLIHRLETKRRGNYAGPCGWVDSCGDGAFIVALRCGALNGNRALLHAGAGIVAGSDPDAEWFETQQKLEPMLRALVRP